MALNIELTLGDDGSLPEWVELIPPGREVKGRDGRAWINDRPQDILAAFRNDFGPIPIGMGHSIELSPPSQSAPAWAWIEGLEVREGGAIWGHVAWNSMGRYAVASREYRYLSPTFLAEKDSGRVVQLLAAGLTNRPNLKLTALNQRETSPEDDPMEWSKVLEALGLGKEATQEQALNAIQRFKDEKQTALNQAQTPSLDKYVPRADYEAAVNAKAATEQKLVEHERAAQAAVIEAAVGAAVEAGTITPAQREQAINLCNTAGLEAFNQFLDKAPRNPARQDDIVRGDPNQPGGAARLTPDQIAVCQRMGVSPKDFAEAQSN